VILSGRRINDGMGGFIAQRLVKLLIAAERPVKGAAIGIIGLTFKENVSDLRNSKVPDIVAELREFGIAALVADPLADPEEAQREYGIRLMPLAEFIGLDGLILAVPHAQLAEAGWALLFAALAPGGVFVDVKSAIARDEVPPHVHYWSL
jgi:UDP-N-acetyl-D-glucosamine/UDP-N-acetyl-D-galactosamine dehydrogenase